MSAMIDWPQLALQLRKHVGPLQTLSRKLGRHHGYLGQIARGEVREPGFSDGLKLLDFAHDHLPPDVFRACRKGETV